MKALYTYKGFVKVASWEGHVKKEKGLVEVEAITHDEADMKIRSWLADKYYIDIEDVIVEINRVPSI